MRTAAAIWLILLAPLAVTNLAADIGAGLVLTVFASAATFVAILLLDPDP